MFQADILVHARFFRVSHGEFYRFRINIASVNIQVEICPYTLFCFVSGSLKRIVIKILPALCGKTSVHSRSDVKRDHRRFDRDGSRSAKGIDKQSFAAPITEQKQTARESFFQRRFARETSVSALMQSRTRGVERYRYNVFEDRNGYSVFRSVLGKDLFPEFKFKLLYNCLFCY